jgi:hypothetical protein
MNWFGLNLIIMDYSKPHIKHHNQWFFCFYFIFKRSKLPSRWHNYMQLFFTPNLHNDIIFHDLKMYFNPSPFVTNYNLLHHLGSTHTTPLSPPRPTTPQVLKQSKNNNPKWQGCLLSSDLHLNAFTFLHWCSYYPNWNN